MKIKDGFMLREVAGNMVVVAVGEASKNFNGLITLNETGAFLWELLSEGKTEEELVSEILDNYAVTERMARQDVAVFIEKCETAGLLEK